MGFRQSFFPSKDLKKLLDLPVHKRKAPLLLNFIPTYKSALPDVPKKKKKKSLSPPSATTPQVFAGKERLTEAVWWLRKSCKKSRH